MVGAEKGRKAGATGAARGKEAAKAAAENDFLVSPAFPRRGATASRSWFFKFYFQFWLHRCCRGAAEMRIWRLRGSGMLQKPHMKFGLPPIAANFMDAVSSQLSSTCSVCPPSLRTSSGCCPRRLPTTTLSFTDLRARRAETERGLEGDGLSRSDRAAQEEPRYEIVTLLSSSCPLGAGRQHYYFSSLRGFQD